MATVHVGGRALETRFAIPSGPAGAVRVALDTSGLGLARARVAAALGEPDPFHVRTACLAGGDVVGCDGDVVSADAMDAALLAADRGGEPRIAGLFAGRPPGPMARSIPVDDPTRTWLKWQTSPTRPARLGAVKSWTTAQIGDTDVATVRCVQPLPGGRVALGSDYGLTIVTSSRSEDTFTPFPWPLGSRREARRVEAMAVHEGALHVATSQTSYVWDFGGKVSSKRYGADKEDGYDDLNALLSVGSRLYTAYRTRFEGGVGPDDALSLAADPSGVVFAGTRDGELHVIDGCGPIRRFADHKPRPVRHLAFAEGALWVAAREALHRFDGAAWTERGPEPTGFTVDGFGRLWALAEGKLHVLRDGWIAPVDVALERPWSIAAVPGALWIGGRERVWKIELA